MSTRDRSSETSWASWYSHQTDEVGTEQLPFTDDSNTTLVGYLPACPNCGWQPEVCGTENPPDYAVPHKCPECWARLVKP
jgi:hypothetical protein